MEALLSFHSILASSSFSRLFSLFSFLLSYFLPNISFFLSSYILPILCFSLLTTSRISVTTHQHHHFRHIATFIVRNTMKLISLFLTTASLKLGLGDRSWIVEDILFNCSAVSLVRRVVLGWAAAGFLGSRSFLGQGLIGWAVGALYLCDQSRLCDWSYVPLYLFPVGGRVVSLFPASGSRCIPVTCLGCCITMTLWHVPWPGHLSS